VGRAWSDHAEPTSFLTHVDVPAMIELSVFAPPSSTVAPPATHSPMSSMGSEVSDLKVQDESAENEDVPWLLAMQLGVF